MKGFFAPLAFTAGMALAPTNPAASEATPGMVITADKEGPRSLTALPWRNELPPPPPVPSQSRLPVVLEGPSRLAEDPVNQRLDAIPIVQAPVAPAAPPPPPVKRQRGARDATPSAPIMKSRPEGG